MTSMVVAGALGEVLARAADPEGGAVGRPGPARRLLHTPGPAHRTHPDRGRDLR